MPTFPKEPTDNMVWALCDSDECKKCAASFEHEQYGKCLNGCYALAAEAYGRLMTVVVPDNSGVA